MQARTLFTSLLILAGVALVPATALHAGPPLLCHQIQIGDAESLPWGSDAFAKSDGYDRTRLVGDTLRLLTPEAPVLTRMETIRRAAMYLEGDDDRAADLFGSLLTRVLDAEVTMDARLISMRYFDAGYFACTAQQAGVRIEFAPATGERSLHGQAPGYSWVVRAYKMNEASASDIALALALMTADTRMTQHTMFLEKAVRSIDPGDAARNDLLAWIGLIRGTTIDELRGQYGRTDADTQG